MAKQKINQYQRMNDDGWQLTSTQPSYNAADAPSYSILFAAGESQNIFVRGMRVRLTDASTTKYFIVTSIGTGGGGEVSLILYGGTDYTLSGGAITNFSYSNVKAPYGFPLQVEKWSIVSTTAETAVATPTNGTWYNGGTKTIVAPIGCWRISYNTPCAAYVASTADIQIYVTLSTSNNSVSYNELLTAARGNAFQYFGALFTASHVVTYTSKTTLYLLERVTTNSIIAIEVAKNVYINLRLECAYL